MASNKPPTRAVNQSDDTSIWHTAASTAEAHRIEAYEFDLDDDRIATTPAEKRHQSRLMVYRPSSPLTCTTFDGIGAFLKADDLLVFNATRVIPARLRVYKETGGKVELFVVHASRGWSETGDKALEFECMARSNRPVREAMVLSDPERPDMPSLTIVDTPGRHVRARLQWDDSPLAFLESYGEVPLPPYILKKRRRQGDPEVTERDRQRYQTVYASQPGAVAAPTAGLHFTRSLLEDLEEKGVKSARLDLTVGPGTFRPVDAETLADHDMHSEAYRIPPDLGEAIERCRHAGGRVIAVGTTSMRTLEAEARRPTPFEPGHRSTDIFLRPGEDYQVCDGLITNFHLPRSTLLALVAGFVGMSNMRAIYQRAVDEGFRFYSYGDSSLLLP